MHNNTAGTQAAPLVVRLISMPFGPLHFPSIALAQLTSAVRERLGDRVRIHLHYLTHDFGELLGQAEYMSVCQNENSADPNYGDWIFSKAAFPEMPDNTDAYFKLVPESRRDSYRAYYQRHLHEAREAIPAFLETLIDRYQLDQADVVGFTSMFAQTIASIAMAKALRRRKPDLFQIMGGANCEYPMGVEYLHNFDCFDAIFSGPGLVSFPLWLERLLADDRAGMHTMNGVFTRENSISAGSLPDRFSMPDKVGVLLKGGIRGIGDERPVSHLLELDYDAFLDDYDRRFSSEIEQPFIVFETSRGCWWGEKAHCTFCGLNGQAMNYRAMDANIAIDFLQGLIRRYGSRVEHLECVDNIMPQNFPREVFPYLDPPEDVSFYWEVKANLKETDLMGLAQANVWEIQPGIEALNTDTLKLMKKGASAFTNIGLLRDAPMYHISVLWYLLMGFPGEPEAVFRKYIEDFPRLAHLRPPVALVPVEFHRFSPYYDRAAEFGLELAPREFYGVNYPLPDKVLANLAYYFRDTKLYNEPDVAIAEPAPEPDAGFFLPPSPDASYKADLKRCWNQLDHGWRHWQRRFDGSDGKSAANLYFLGGHATHRVIDTRDGTHQRHHLDELDYRILRFLEKARRLAAVLKEFAGAGEAAVRASVRRLDEELQLVFREDDMLMSLVPRQRRVSIAPPLSRGRAAQVVPIADAVTGVELF